MLADKGLVVFIICTIIILIFFAPKIETMITHSAKCNEIDGRCYEVIERFVDADKASEYLAKINKFNIALMRHLRKKYIFDGQGTPYRRRLITLLLDNYNVDALVENNPSNNVNTSYVEDKGKIFAICLREKESGTNQLHDFSLLKYVILHELAHLSTELYGHPERFWLNFKILIEEAKAAGLYDPVDYEKYPVNYCYLDITYNPYFHDYVEPYADK
jgi:transcriptional antiterminator